MGMIVTRLSTTQLETFDPEQQGCPRQWFFDHSEKRVRQTKGPALLDGDAGHALLANYFERGVIPGRTRMGTAVRAAIEKGELPFPGQDLLVETRFDGTKSDPNDRWGGFNPKTAYRIGGIPFEGFIDLAFGRVIRPEVWDHKFTSDINGYAKTEDQLIKTIQMPVYAASQFDYWENAKEWRLVHHYVSRVGKESKIVAKVVSTDQILERIHDIETRLIPAVQEVAQMELQEDVPYNLGACNRKRGCSYQSICSAFKGEKQNMAVSASELEALALDENLGQEDLEEAGFEDELPPMDDSAPPVPAPVPAPPPAPANMVCECGQHLDATNGSKKKDGTWVHIGCPKNAPPPVVAPPKTAKKKMKITDLTTEGPSEPPAPVVASAEVVEPPKVKAIEVPPAAPKQEPRPFIIGLPTNVKLVSAPPAPTKPATVTTFPASTPPQRGRPLEFTAQQFLELPRGDKASMLADLLESIARLLRT